LVLEERGGGTIESPDGRRGVKRRGGVSLLSWSRFCCGRGWARPRDDGWDEPAEGEEKTPSSSSSSMGEKTSTCFQTWLLPIGAGPRRLPPEPMCVAGELDAVGFECETVEAPRTVVLSDSCDDLVSGGEKSELA
jgi:hypothetical protein